LSSINKTSEKSTKPSLISLQRINGIPLCDTTYYAIKSITQVYVDYGDGSGWQTIAHSNEDLTNATFTINTASFVVGTSRVKVAFEGYHSGGVLIEGAPEIVEDLLLTWCGLSATDLDSTVFTTSKTESTYVLNVPIESTTSALTIIEKICQSDCAQFSENASGQLRYKKWIPTQAGLSNELTKLDIWDVDFEEDLSSQFWKARISYNYQCADGSYSYTDYEDEESKYKYGRQETLSLQTYLRTLADADDLAWRMNVMTKDLPTIVKRKSAPCMCPLLMLPTDMPCRNSRLHIHPELSEVIERRHRNMDLLLM